MDPLVRLSKYMPYSLRIRFKNAISKFIKLHAFIKKFTRYKLFSNAHHDHDHLNHLKSNSRQRLNIEEGGVELSGRFETLDCPVAAQL